ncbi:MAG TPA: hypothetical protein VK184_00095 [Nostocaceae cyanobacterium]|nr:hypothetical protein [Nostocaceae cyanobacterium]
MLIPLYKPTLLIGITISTLLIVNSSAFSCLPVKSPTTNTNHSVTPINQTFRGLLIYESLPPGRSVRAYKGEEFFLLTNLTNNERIVLRPSDQVYRSELESFHNQKVEITAVYFAGTRPPLDRVACPLDVDGSCMIQGEGYRVLSIRNLK